MIVKFSNIKILKHIIPKSNNYFIVKQQIEISTHKTLNYVS